MAAQSLCGHIYLYLLMSFFVGGSKVPCEQHLRSRKPLLESLQWEAYWVPLMIILGGCCAMAWSILFIAYDVGQERGKMLPQIPAAQEEEQKEEWPKQQVPPEETKEDSNLPEGKNSKELLGTLLQTKGSREGIDLNQKGSQEAIGTPQQSEESKEVEEGPENQLEIKTSQDVVENQLETKGSQNGIGSPFLQGENEPASFTPSQAEDQPCGKLWTTMEKELERLLQLLHFCRSSAPDPLAEEFVAPAVEEFLAPAVEEAMSPPATETPSPAAEEIPQPTPAQESPAVPPEETPRPLNSRQNPATMHFIICGLPSNACQSRASRRRRGGSRGRK